MITSCRACRKPVNDRTDVRWTWKGVTLCSLRCVWTWRGKEKVT